MSEGPSGPIKEKINNQREGSPHPSIAVPPKPPAVRFDHLNLRGRGGTEEREYLYAVLEKWYDIKRDQIFKRPSKSPIWDERALLKIAILKLEEWSDSQIADAFDAFNNFREDIFTAATVHNARTRYLGNSFIKERKRWTEEENKKLAEDIYREQSYATLFPEEKQRLRIAEHTRVIGDRIRASKLNDPAWEPWLPKLSNTAAFIAFYTDQDFEKAISIAKKLHKPRGSRYPADDLKKLASGLLAGKSYGKIAKEWKVPRSALIGKARREGLALLEEHKDDPEWQERRGRLTPVAAFLSQYMENLDEAILAAEVIRRRQNPG